MKQVFRVFWGCTLAAALALTGCGRGGAPGSSGAGSMSGSGSGAMSGGTAGQEQAWRTGLGVVTEAAGSDRAGKITTAAAAVVLDADGKLADVMLDELELSVSGGSTGSVTTPEDVRSKRTKGGGLPAGGGVLPRQRVGRAGRLVCRLSDRQDPGRGKKAENG